MNAKTSHWKVVNDQLRDDNARLLAENVRLTAESDALRRDAERYRWLTSIPAYAFTYVRVAWEQYKMRLDYPSFRDILSDEIDAAMAGEKKDGVS